MRGHANCGQQGRGYRRAASSAARHLVLCLRRRNALSAPYKEAWGSCSSVKMRRLCPAQSHLKLAAKPPCSAKFGQRGARLSLCHLICRQAPCPVSAAQPQERCTFGLRPKHRTGSFPCVICQLSRYFLCFWQKLLSQLPNNGIFPHWGTHHYCRAKTQCNHAS